MFFSIIFSSSRNFSTNRIFSWAEKHRKNCEKLYSKSFEKWFHSNQILLKGKPSETHTSLKSSQFFKTAKTAFPSSNSSPSSFQPSPLINRKRFQLKKKNKESFPPLNILN
eukprot:Sdes_comp20871_c1_seq1m17806